MVTYAPAANVLESDMWTRVAYYAAPVQNALRRIGGFASGNGMTLEETLVDETLPSTMHLHEDIGDTGATVDIEFLPEHVYGVVAKPGVKIENPELTAETIIRKVVIAAELVGITFLPTCTPEAQDHAETILKPIREKRLEAERIEAEALEAVSTTAAA
ncbi:MAG: hypothetical protein JWO47_396 [Candidatus Saccharibacteria bacterium]|nr:hypothetical protein [Candidatus Saccharibacteria bacterium]